MYVIATSAPVGPIEPAPITNLLLDTELAADRLSAFWTDGDDYVLRADGAAGVRWYRIAVEAAAAPASASECARWGALLADVIPLGGGRVAFPVGSTGRRVYRVWRSAGRARGATTRILGARAGRSRRQPA